MLLIGEKLNVHAYKKVALAVKNRDSKFMLDEARKQIDLGANVIDVHGGGMEDQLWALRALSELKFPLSVDNMDPAVIRAGLGIGEVKYINSIGEGRLDLFKDAKEHGVEVIGLLFGLGPEKMLKAAEEHGFDRAKLLLDPAVQSVGADPKQGQRIIKDHRELKAKYKVRTVAGIGNVSATMPGKTVELHVALLMSLMHDGLDAAIINVEKLAWFAFAKEVLDDPSGKALMRYLKRYKAEVAQAAAPAPKL
jgi:cobalamin-dependent methionine synthase I